MKYRVGDKVRVLSVDYASDDDEDRFLNKIKTIIHIWEDNEEGYYYGLENECWSPLYFKECQLLDMRRDYVVVCMRHKGLIRDALLFWGAKTEDDDCRSTSGYTVDIDRCERFTRMEVESEGFNIVDVCEKGIPKHGDFAVRVKDLLSFGFKEYRIIA